MIIKSKPLGPFLFRLLGAVNSYGVGRFARKTDIRPIDIKPDHSYILMCNHFSFADGFFAFFLCNKVFWGKNKMRRMYIMSLKKQMEKHWWLRHVGSFSIEPRKRSMLESFAYAGEVLSQPGNLLIYYPQGNLESNHISHIQFEHGLSQIVPLIKGKCQIIWSSNIIEYFEGIKPVVQFNMLDCGTNEDFDFEALQAKINQHHLNCLNKNIRFTNQPIR